MGVNIPSMEEGNAAKHWIQRVQAWFGQENSPGSFLAKAPRAEQTKWNRTWKPQKQTCKTKQRRSTSLRMTKQASHLCGGKWAPNTKAPSQPQQFRPSTVALWEICQYQKTAKLLLWKLPFQRLVSESMQYLQPDKGFQGMGALQEAVEAHLMVLFEDMNLCTLHTKWVTILSCDMQLAQRIQGNWFRNWWHWCWVECRSVPGRSL